MAEWILTDKDIGMDGAYYDYPELIRCKDCANHEPEDYCHIRDGLWYDNDYCSSAERKTDDA